MAVEPWQNQPVGICMRLKMEMYTATVAAPGHRHLIQNPLHPLNILRRNHPLLNLLRNIHPPNHRQPKVRAVDLIPNQAEARPLPAKCQVQQVTDQEEIPAPAPGVVVVVAVAVAVGVEEVVAVSEAEAAAAVVSVAAEEDN